MRNPLAGQSGRFTIMRNRLQRLNPDADVDSILDKTLEPEEARNAVVEKYHLLTTDDSEAGQLKYSDYREAMSDQYGIDNRRIQDMIAQTDPVMTPDEMGQLSYAIHGRSEHAMRIDRSKKAKMARDARQYMNKPNRFDIPTWDSIIAKPRKTGLFD